MCSRILTGWDKGFRLIPVGHLAIKQINNRSDIPPSYQLELIDIESEACGIITGIWTFIGIWYSPTPFWVGWLGISAPLSQGNLSSCEPPRNRDYSIHFSLVPRHWCILNFSTQYKSFTRVFTVVTLMAKFQWQKIGLIYNSVGRPKARIFAKGVTWVCDVYACITKARLKGSGGMLPQDRCSEIASEAILGQKLSRSSSVRYVARGVLFGCPCRHLLSQPTSPAGRVKDSEIVCREYWKYVSKAVQAVTY